MQEAPSDSKPGGFTLSPNKPVYFLLPRKVEISKVHGRRGRRRARIGRRRGRRRRRSPESRQAPRASLSGGSPPGATLGPSKRAAKATAFFPVGLPHMVPPTVARDAPLQAFAKLPHTTGPWRPLGLSSEDLRSLGKVGDMSVRRRRGWPRLRQRLKRRRDGRGGKGGG